MKIKIEFDVDSDIDPAIFLEAITKLIFEGEASLSPEEGDAIDGVNDNYIVADEI